MNLKHPKIFFALALPILCLMLLAGYKSMKVSSGTKIEIPIVGFDPRDLLSGHYLEYRLDLPTDNPCANSDYKTQSSASVCLLGNGKHLSGFIIDPTNPNVSNKHCRVILNGDCQKKRFIAGIERFYIPEGDAKALDRVVRNKKGSIIVSVPKIGKPIVKELLIEGMPWKKYLKQNPK